MFMLMVIELIVQSKMKSPVRKGSGVGIKRSAASRLSGSPSSAKK